MTLDHTIYFFYFACYAHHRDLHSFPTRRSSDLDKSKSWKERKQHTIDIIKTARKEVKYLIVADKLENLLSNEAALKEKGDTAWDNFNAGKDLQKWYYVSIAENMHPGLETQDIPDFF